jgi:large subunit ribosomal protein L31
MKPKIHPKYNKLTIQFPQGDSFETNSTYSGGKLLLDVDFRKHPAWTKQGISKASDSSVTVTKFNKKFGSFDFAVGANKKAADKES